MTSLPDCSVAAGEMLFEALYIAHKPAVHGVALRLLGNEHDAEEVTQETFLNAYRALADGTSPKDPRAWLLAIARNACRARWRRSGYPVQEVPLEDELAAASGAGEASEAGDVRTALEQLLPTQRLVLVLRELLGLSFGEIANRLGRSESAVHTLLFRARSTMREELEAARSPLSCSEAETLLGQRRTAITRPDRSLLRAHLRHCAACEIEARRRRARHAALGLLAVPLQKLGSWLGIASTGSPAARIGALVGAAALAGVTVQTGSLGLGPPDRAQAPGSPLVAAAGIDRELPPAAFVSSGSATRPAPAGRREEVSGQTPHESQHREDGSQAASPVPAEPDAAESAPVRSDPDVSRGGARGTERLAGRPDGGAVAPADSATQALAQESKEPLTEVLAGVAALIPELTAPEFALPEVALPELAVAEVTLPAVTSPEVTLPEVTVPDATVPLPDLPVSTTASSLLQVLALD